jgi:1-deoxy-D-xylulose-5-phosphate reductoisomerase
MRRVHVLGSTGSIGRTAEQVLEELVATHEVVGLSAGKDASRIVAQAERWRPRAVALADAQAASGVRSQLDALGVRLFAGPGAAAEMVATIPSDVVLNGISGAAGLAASFAAIRRGATLALANKESMVMAGPLLVREAARSGATLLPVDSEHNAIFQCLGDECLDGVRRLLLTASGGPFRETPANELERVTPAQALRHPTWNMGDKITIDSATLMNKAL